MQHLLVFMKKKISSFVQFIHSGPATGHGKKKFEFLFENLWVECQDSRAFSSSNSTKKIPSITKVMFVGVWRLEGFLCSSNFDVFKNRKSMIK